MIWALLTIDLEIVFFSLLSREYILLSMKSYSNNVIVIDSMHIQVCEFVRTYFSKYFKVKVSYGRFPLKNKLTLDLSFMKLLHQVDF